VKKKSGKYWFINTTIHINKVTIRDANIPLDINEFAEDFRGMTISLLIDWYLGYDQIPLDKYDCNLTVVIIPWGLI
jgi:hypothetical protein